MEHTILEAKQTPSKTSYVILCELPTNSVTPYATWITSDLQGTTPRFSGHYFRTLPEARRDFAGRIC